MTAKNPMAKGNTGIRANPSSSRGNSGALRTTLGSATARSSLDSDAAAKLVNTGAFRTDVVVMDRGAKADVPPARRSSDRIEDGVFMMRMIAVLRVCVFLDHLCLRSIAATAGYWREYDMRWLLHIILCVCSWRIQKYLCSLCNARARRKGSEVFSREEKMLFEQEIQKTTPSQENEIIPKAKRQPQ